MTDIEQTRVAADDFTTGQSESTDPAYLAWKKKKIEAALQDSEQHPEQRRSADEVFGELYRHLSRES